MKDNSTERNAKNRAASVLKPLCVCSMLFANALPAPIAAAEPSGSIPDPVHYFSFDEGNAADLAGEADGTLEGSASTGLSAKGLGKALDLSAGGYVRLGDALSLGRGDFTIAFLVKNLQEENDTVLFGNKTGDSGKDDGFGVFCYDGVFGNAGSGNVRYDTSSYGRDKDVLDGEWHYVVITGDRDQAISLYVDGNLSASNTDFADIADVTLDTGMNYVLGAGSTGKYQHKGLYDELKIYDQALSAEQIEQLSAEYDRRMTLDEDLELYLDFEDESFTDLTGKHTVTAQGTAASVEGNKGQAFSTKDGGYLQIDDSFSLNTQDFTVSFWYKADESVNGAVLFGNKDGSSGYHQGFFMCNWDGLYANYGDGSKRYDTSSYSRDQVIMDGGWHLVTVTADRDGALSLYRDGQLSAANASASALNEYDLDSEFLYTIGAGTKGTQLQSGSFDEFQVYSRALSAEEVQGLFLADQDVRSELEEALNKLEEKDIRVPMGADESMVLKAVKEEVQKTIGSVSGAGLEITKEGEGFKVVLVLAGITASRVVNFNIQPKDTLTVASFNIYGWGYPSMAQINEVLKSMDADVAGLQECNHNINGGGQDEQLTAQGNYPYYAFKAGYSSPTQWGGSTIVSKYPLAESGGGNYTVNDHTNRSYCRALIHVDGKEVALYTSHIIWYEDKTEYHNAKQAQLNELIEAVENDPAPYKIITGDLNTDENYEELDNMLLHFNSANGWNNTWLKTHELVSPMTFGSIDHILFTTNIELVDCGVVEGNPSDHDPIWAELRLLDEEPTLPVQLVSNTLLQAQEKLDSYGDVLPDGADTLLSVMEEVQAAQLTEENRLDYVKRLRQAMNQLGEKLYVKTIDDTDEEIIWSEGGANGGGWNTGVSGSEAQDSEHYANKPGASFTLPFEGQRLEIYGPKAPNHRKFSVSIDGGEPAICDAYAETRTDTGTKLYDSAKNGPALEEGDHTAVITVLEDKNENADADALGMSVTFFKTYSSSEYTDPVADFPGYSIVEDMMTTSSDELFKVKYNGTWSGGTSYYPDMFHDGYEHYAHSGDSFEIRFTGSKAEMWGTVDPGHGEYTYSIDGEEIGTASAAGSSRVHQQMIFETPELEYGEHTLKVELKGQSDKAIQLDYLKIYHELITPESITLDQKQILLSPGATQTLTASFTPWTAVGKMTWKSSDPSVVTVKKGVLQAAEDLEEAATATVTVSCGSVSTSVEVTVDPDVLVYTPYTETHTALRSAFYAGSVPDNTWVFAGGRTTMGAFSDIRGTRNYVRLLEEYWRYDGRHRNDMSVNNYRAYMHNTAATGESLSDTVAKFDSVIRPLNPRFVSYMIDEEDFSQGKAGLTQFRTDLQTLIDKALSLRNCKDSFLAIETPWAREDAMESDNAARYALAARQVIDNLPDEQRNRIMLVDLYSATDTSSFRSSSLKEDGSLTNAGHLQLANAISSVLYGSGSIPLSSSSLQALKEVSQPSVYLKETPAVTAGSHSVAIAVDDEKGSAWNFTLQTSGSTISGPLENGKAQIDHLQTGETYVLTVTSQDGKTQYRKVSGTVGEGKTAVEVSPIPTDKTDNQKKIEEVVQSDEPKTWLFIGDSITHGAAWTSGYDSCTQNFEKYLKEDLGRKDDVVINTAISGATSEDHINDPDYRVKNYTADVAVIMLGMNDFHSGMTVETFKQNLKTIAVWCLENNPDCQIVLRACQSLSDAPADQAKIDAQAVFCRAVNETAAEEDWILADHYATWETARQELDYIGHSGYWNGNYAHPNGRGHQVMLRDLLEAMGLQNTESELYNMEYDLSLRNDKSSVLAPAETPYGKIRVDMSEVQQAVGSVIGKADLSVEIDGMTYARHWSVLDKNPIVEISSLPAFKNARVHIKTWLKDEAKTVELNSVPLVSELALDKEDLQALVNQADVLKQEDYTEKSWTAFAKALEQAKDVLADADALLSTVSAAYLRLSQAMEALQHQVDLPEAEIIYDFEGDPLKDKAGIYDASVVGSETYESGYKGQAFSTDGTSAVAIGEDLRLGTDDFTISYWIRVDKNVNNTSLFSNKTADKGTESGIFIRNYNGVYVNAADGTNRYDTDLYDHDTASLNGNWHLITAVFDRDRAVSLYVDGKLYNENTDFGQMASAVLDTGSPILLGCGPLKDGLKGAVDEFHFYRAALDASQAEALYSMYDAERKEARENLKALQEQAIAFCSSTAWETLNQTLKNSLDEALDKAFAALSDTSGAAAPCLNACVQLKAALEAAKKGIGLEELTALVEEAQTIQNEGWTQESWDAFAAALETARALVDAQSTDARAIEEACGALQDAMNALEKHIFIPEAELRYSFEEGSLLDQAGHYHATAVGTPAYESGFKGQAFTTGSAYATIDEAFRMGTDDITISFWVRVDKSANNIGFFSNKKSDGGTEQGVFMRTWNGVYVNAADGTTRCDTDTYTHDTSSLDGRWHMLTAVFDRDRALSLYVDGALFIENTNFTALQGKSLDSGNPFIIGAAAASSSRPQGAMDEFTIYRAALDAAQIQKVYDDYQNEKEAARTALLSLQEKALAFQQGDAWNALEEDLQNTLTEALSGAEAALSDTSNAMEPLLQAATALQAAMDAAGISDEPAESADRTLLNAAIAYVRALSEDDLKHLNPIVRQELEAALEAAESLPEDASQDKVNAAWLRLTRVIHMLGFTSDKAELQALIAEAEAIDLDAYKEEGKEAFLAALAHAKEVAVSETALDSSIQEAVTVLQEAMNALEPKAALDTSLLALLLASTSEAAEEDYTPSTWQNFQSARASAQAVLESPESQEQINETVTVLHSTWLNLRLKPSEELLAALQNFSDQISQLNLDLFGEQERDLITTLKADVDSALANENLSQEEAAALTARIISVESVIDKTAGKLPDISSRPSGQTSAIQSGQAAMKENGNAVSKSVKTAFTSGADLWICSAAAALPAFSLLKKRRDK